MLSFNAIVAGYEAMDQLTDHPEEMARALNALSARGIDELGQDVADYLSDEQATQIAGTLHALANAIDPSRPHKAP